MICNIINTCEWNNLVLNSSDGTIFQTSYWFEKSTSTFVILGYYENNTLLGGIILETDEQQKKGRLGSLAPYLGIFTGRFSNKREEFIKQQLITHIKEKVSNITFFTSPWLDNLNLILKNRFDAKLNYTYIISISNINSVLSAFRSNLKRNIRTCLKANYLVYKEYDTTNLISLVKKTFERQNIITWFNIEEAENCMQSLIDNNFGAIFTTFSPDKKPVASVGVVWDKRSGYYIMGGYDYEISHRGASSIAMWEAIKLCNFNGLEYFDLEGSRLLNIDMFFKQFGGFLKPYYQIVEFQDTITIY
jgi:hypothetical protein